MICPRSGPVNRLHALLRDLVAGGAKRNLTAAQIQAAVAARGTTLTSMHGIGPVLAAKTLGHTGDIRRFPRAGHALAALDLGAGTIVPGE